MEGDVGAQGKDLLERYFGSKDVSAVTELILLLQRDAKQSVILGKVVRSSSSSSTSTTATTAAIRIADKAEYAKAAAWRLQLLEEALLAMKARGKRQRPDLSDDK